MRCNYEQKGPPISFGLTRWKMTDKMRHFGIALGSAVLICVASHAKAQSDYLPAALPDIKTGTHSAKAV